MSEEELTAAVGLILLVFIAFLVWNSGQKKLAQRRLRLEEQNALLDRIGSGGALAEFLQSKPGQQLLDRLNEPERHPEKPTDIRSSVMTLLTCGAILPFIGIALIPVAILAEWEMLIPAGILIGAGLGCLIAAVIQRSVGKRLGLFDESRENADSETRASP
jgi:hypothetical protein